MNTEILKPTLNNANICVHPVQTATKDNTYPFHFHNECEMYLCIKGQMTFLADNESFDLCDGDIIFVNETIPHETVIKKGTTGFLIQFSPDTNMNEVNKHLRRYSIFMGKNCAVFKSGSHPNSEIRNCLDQIICENNQKAPSYDKYIKACVQMIIAVLYRENILKDEAEFLSTKNISKLLPVIEYINLHYSEEITLEDISRIMNIDKSHFCRIFKKAMNTSFVKYLNFVRVCKAEKLLLETNKTVAQIADEVGFSSPSYFAETFRKHRFCSPAMYRKIKNLSN